MGTTVHQSRNSTYDIMKLFFALMVIFSHSWELLEIGVEGEMQLMRLFNRSPGNVAVHAFFVLSGYFITMSCQRARSTGDYLWKRVLRIVPAYFLAISFSYMLGNACNRFADLPTPYILNGSVWTLYYEIALYLCIAVMKPLGLLKKEVVGSIGCVVFFVLMINSQTTEAFSSIVLPMIFMFVFGSYVYLSEAEAAVERAGILGVGGMLLIQFWPGGFELAGKALPLIYGPDMGVALMMAVYLVSLPTVVLWLGRAVKISLPRFPDLSYGVYLYGWPIQQSIIYYYCVVKGRGITPPLLLMLSIAGSLPVAALSWYAVEKYVLKAKNWYWSIKMKMKQLLGRKRTINS